MALPTIETPTYRTKVPSTGKEIEFRPFLVKEEKILFMATEGSDAKEIEEATKKILENCIHDELDINKLATFDIEYLFLQLRAKSVGEEIDVTVSHTSDDECRHKTDMKIAIDDIKVNGIVEEKNIMIKDDIGVKVRYPSMEDAKKLSEIEEKDLSPLSIIANCIECVFDNDSVYDDFSVREMEMWLENLNQKQFANIAKFFNNIPRLSYDVKWTCEKCGKEDSFNVEGLASFFTLL